MLILDQAFKKFSMICLRFKLVRNNNNHIIFIHSFIPAISIAPLQVLYYSKALPTTARILYQSFMPRRTGNCR